jgi:hypothetical protein
MFASYLTWDELIHTAYFNIPRFRKLVAYAIAQADGFQATEAFKADPDYATVAGWYDGMQRARAEASKSQVPTSPVAVRRPLLDAGPPPHPAG